MSTTETVVTDKGEVKEQTFQDDLQKLTFESLVSLIEKRNSLVAEVNASAGDRASLIEQFTEKSDNPEIVAAREARDEAIMRLHELVTPLVNERLENKDQNKDQVEADLKAIDEKLKPGVTYYKKIYGDEAAEFFPTQTRLKGMSVKTGGGGGRRIRGYAVDVTLDGETTRLENFAAAAKFLDVETTQLQEAFFEAAGNPKALKDAPDTVEFEVTFTEVDEDDNETQNTASFVAVREGKDEAKAESKSDEDDE